MKPEDQLIQQRKNNLEELKKLNIDVYPYSYNKTHDASEILKLKLKKEEKSDKKVSLAGRIVSLRIMGKASFGHLQDETGKIQFYIREEDVKDYNVFRKLIDLGDFIGISGIVFKTKTDEISIWVKSFQLLVKSLRPLPEKWHGLQDTEIRYRQRYLDLIVNPGVKEVFLKRAQIYKAIREFLDKKGFIEVEVPILQTQYGGANAKPFKTKINAWNMDMFLRIAYELHLKRLIIGGFEKIYALGSCFRNEGIDPTHNPEFSMMEIQWAYKDYNDAMKLTEELWEYVSKQILGTTKINYQGTSIDLKAPWKKLTMLDAIKQYLNLDIEKLNENEIKEELKKNNLECFHYSKALAIELLFTLVEPKLIQPVHITDHPKETCPLAKQHRKNPFFIERVEPFINGWEVGNSYSELNDPKIQKELFEEQVKKGRGGDEEAHPMDEDYVKALEYGLPPNVGIGIGIDRMIMLLTNSKTIRDVILFPIMKPEKS
ncbi:MAG: lysine--tRNA ligase [archaeon]